MMMKKAAITYRTALVLVLGLSLPAVARAAGVTVTPPSVAADYVGPITLNITGLTIGQTVVVEKFLDVNNNGLVDASDRLVQRFTVTDGVKPKIAGVRNRNVPGDEDGTADGQIQTVVDFQAQAEANHAVADYIYQVAATTAQFTITQPSFSQGVAGQVTSGGSPVPSAFVALMTPSGFGLTLATISEANGNFTLNAPPGTYSLFAIKKGFVFDSSMASVTVNTGAMTTMDLSLLATDHTISGQLSDAANGVGIAAVQIFVQSDDKRYATIAHTDDQGNFDVSVLSSAASTWRLEPSNRDAALLSYSAPHRVKVNASAGDVAGLSLQWPRVNALIYGNLTDSSNTALAGIEFFADDSSNQYENFGISNLQGKYSVGVTAGTWNVGPSSDDPGLAGYVISGQTVTVGVGQALQVDFVAQHANAHLIGRLVDTLSNGVGNIGVSACPQGPGGGSCSNSQTAADGSFSVGVSGGMWNLGFSSGDLASRNLIGPQLPFTVTDGVDQSGITAVALPVTAQITGTVRDGGGNPVANLGVYAFATLNGTQYNANGQTDNGGSYSLSVANGDWQVGLDCNGLSSRGLACPNNQPITIPNGGQTVDFIVESQAPSCVGDCNDDHQVTVDEILTMVNIALGNADVASCHAGDGNTDGQITVDEVLAAVNSALNGCAAA